MGATALAIALLFVGAAAADTHRLPFIHGWALVHGTIFVVFPAHFVLSYFLLWPFARQFRQRDIQTPQPIRKFSILGVVSLLLSGSGFLIPFFGSVLGIVVGHVARHRHKKDPQLSGAGFALSGLILGYLGPDVR